MNSKASQSQTHLHTYSIKENNKQLMTRIKRKLTSIGNQRQIQHEFVNGEVESDRLDLIQLYREMITLESKYDNHHLSDIVANHRVDAATTFLHSRRLRNKLESMCLLYTDSSLSV